LYAAMSERADLVAKNLQTFGKSLRPCNFKGFLRRKI
jgi:hypothetical protein